MSKRKKQQPETYNWWSVVRLLQKFKVPPGSVKDVQFGYSAGYWCALKQLEEVSRCPAELIANYRQFYEAAREDMADAERQIAERRGPIDGEASQGEGRAG